MAGNAWRVQDGYGKGDGPHPEHLEYPEAEEWEKFVAHGVEAAVFAGLENTEEEESGEAEAPEH